MAQKYHDAVDTQSVSADVHPRRVERSPQASSTAALKRMQKQRQRDTKPEVTIRRLLHSWGLRYFIDRTPLPSLRRRADIVFPTARVAVFVDGCFWHACPTHGTLPKANRPFWKAKLAANRLRDADTNAHLISHGWQVVRAWEHESAHEVARRIHSCVVARRDGLGQGRAAGSATTD